MDAGDTGIEHLVKASGAKPELSVKAHITERSGVRCTLKERLVKASGAKSELSEKARITKCSGVMCSLSLSKHWNFIILGTYMD